MWCASCRSDVAAEVSSDNRHVNCATCGGPIATPLSGRTLSRTQQARELLERWSLDRQSDRATATANATEADSAEMKQAEAVYSIKRDKSAAVPARTGSETPRPHLRMDGGHRPGESTGRNRDSTSSSLSAEVPVSDGPRPRQPARRRVESAHATAGPHVPFPKPATKWVPMVGQSLAYAGVLGLMAGACLVILGYFRGPASYAPTGWLITMAGQMLLFLGVVTLVSTGMEETTNTVANRIDRLDEKLLRIERATSELRGPSGGADGFTSENAATGTASPQREISRAG
jgi:hypothetical protein